MAWLASSSLVMWIVAKATFCPSFQWSGALSHSAPAMDHSVSPDHPSISLREMMSDGLKVIGTNSAISFS
jgi:hypothetical protein